MWRLFFPLRYLSLRNREKQAVELWATIGLAAFLSLPYIVFKETSFFGGGGFLDKIVPLMSTLTGFYVTALVAAATFTHPDLDKTITIGRVALVSKSDSGEQIQDFLTRRQFATMMFGYLSFMALTISLVGSVLVTLSAVDVQRLAEIKGIGTLFTPDIFVWIRAGVVAVCTLSIANVAVVTSMGLYYLMDRLHVRAPRITTKKADSDDRAA